MDESLVQFDGVNVKIGNKLILEDINWTINKNCHYAIAGSMGSGKTVLSLSLIGKAHISSGRINYDFLPGTLDYTARNNLIKRVSFTDQSKLFVGPNADHYYQQRYNSFDSDGHLTVLDYLIEHGLDQASSYHSNILNIFGLNSFLEKERIKLSSGQTRKLILASALIIRPRILWLDNPYVGLDQQSRIILNKLLEQIAGLHQVTLILSGHFTELPQCINKYLLLENGSIAEKSNRPILPKKFSPPELSAELVDYFKNINISEQQSAVVKMEDVSIVYDKKPVVGHFNWEVLRGEKWALLGSNGSGKSSLLSYIYADHPQAYANGVSLFGKKRGEGESIWEVKRRIGFTSPELHAYFRYNMTALELVASGIHDRFTFKPIDHDIKKIVEKLFRYFGMVQYLDFPYKHLSSGIQRLCFLMRALIKNPELLVLDEPFQGFDQDTILRAKSLLNKVLSPNHTVIFISHFKEEIPSIIARFKVLE